MSDTEAMVRLMDAASDQLRAAIVEIRALRSPNSSELAAYTQAIAAMAYGRGVMQMVAASVAPEGRQRTALIAARIEQDYAAWAEENRGALMTDGELSSIVAFIRSVVEVLGDSR